MRFSLGLSYIAQSEPIQQSLKSHILENHFEETYMNLFMSCGYYKGQGILRVASCELRVRVASASCEFELRVRVASCEFQFASSIQLILCELNNASCEFLIFAS